MLWSLVSGHDNNDSPFMFTAGCRLFTCHTNCLALATSCAKYPEEIVHGNKATLSHPKPMSATNTQHVVSLTRQTRQLVDSDTDCSSDHTQTVTQTSSDHTQMVTQTSSDHTQTVTQISSDHTQAVASDRFRETHSKHVISRFITERL